MRWLLLMLLLATAPAARSLATGHPQAASDTPARTGKERLTDKGSDEQRVNDCKVPPSRRTRPRPTDCPER